MDAYHAPYSRRHRYWTGLMLLTRCILFLAFATNYSSDEIVANSYITTLVILGILLIKTYSTKVYRSFWKNLLELSFLCNMEILSATLSYFKGTISDDNSMICKSINASISISFITFIGILAYHAYLQMERTRWYVSTKQAVLSKLPIRQHPTSSTEDNLQVPKAVSLKALPSTSLVELREELLASN